MDFDNQIDNFSRTALGYVTAAIAAIFFLLAGLLVTKLFSGPSFQLVGFALTMVFLAGWFAKLSYQLIFQVTQKQPRLFSPLSIMLIFTVFGLGALIGIIFRFTAGEIEQGIFCIFILLMLLPSGHYCYLHAKNKN